MTILVTLENVSLAFGLDKLLDQVKLQISKGERVCLIGRNGAGKSSLMKVIEGAQLPDSGKVWRNTNLRIARLAQELPQHETRTVYEFVADGLADIGQLLVAYHALIHDLAAHPSDKQLNKLEKLQHEIDAKKAWQFEQRMNTILTRLELDPDKKVTELSGGWQRRAALAQALVSSPELLLLDEPTNHLDIEAIQWLENQLLDCNIALLFITHDRSLLRKLATRIIELDRGNLTSWPGDYDNFLARKEEMLHAEDKQHADFDKKLMQEEKWIRQGIKARRTRNEGRVRALEAMRRERSMRREVQGKTTFNLNEAEKSGQLVVEVKNISFGFNDRILINNFSTRIMRGDRIALIGPNGIGKSTLLNILLGNLAPQAGEVHLGTKLKVAYFDQLRQALNPEKTVIENVGEGSDTIEINGQRKHIISYLNDFLFTPQRAMTPVKALSGGECNRLLLARLFSQPSNLLIMDEPTNDLDIETLELLEELIEQYQGTLLLVSHDRAFVDNVVTSTIAFEGNGRIEEYVGGYQDWLRQRDSSLQSTKSSSNIESASSRSSTAENNTVKQRDDAEKTTKTKKLSFKEQRELNDLPAKIEALEAEQAALQQQFASAEFYKQDPKLITQATARLKQLEDELLAAYKKWEALQ